MQTLQDEVKTALAQVAGVTVYYAFPSSWAAFPIVTWREADNKELKQVEGREYQTEVIYVIDIWSKTPEANASTALLVDTELAKLRLKRVFSTDLFETESKWHHKVMRYRATIIGNLIYQ